VFVAVMYVAASVTAGRRVTHGASAGWVAGPILASTLPVLTALLLTGVLPSNALAVIPVSGIMIGGAMTASTLAGRRALDDLAARRGEVEAALSIGLPARDAALEICRPAASNAMIPILDQTRTVGLVTLPGAFVGMLLGGASPVEAGAVQLFVLVALLAVEAIAVVLVTEAVARGTIRRDG
jgi:putative ABC transport system permease protein